LYNENVVLLGPTACRISGISEQAGQARADKGHVRIRNSIGCPVEGQNFFNRDDEQAQLWLRLETDHVLLLAPRRVGKTSLLYRLEATAERHKFKSIYVSVASHSTEVAFLRALIEKVAEPGRFGRKLVGGAGKLLLRIKSLSVSEVSVELEAQQWQDIGDDFLRMLQTSKQRCLVMLDELPIFVLNLLHAHEIELHPEICEHMLDKVGWLIPYHLQLLFSAVRDLGDGTPTIETVERAYAGLLASHHKGYFDPWYQRLRDELGLVDEGHALALLEAAASDSGGAPTGVLHELLRSRGANHDLTRYILGVLANDGYLVVVDERWRFRSPLLRDYWRSMVLT
jgi:hypothetical protein